VAYLAFAGLAVLRLWRKIMKRRRARQHAYAKNQLHTMIERGDFAGLILALFSIVVIKSVVALVSTFFRLVKKIVSVAVATTYTTIFAIQVAVARNRALQGSDERTRWFGRATIMRAADVLVFARCWPLRPNTFVARHVLKVAGKAAIIGLQSGDMTPEEARGWLTRIKRQTVPRPAQASEAQSHPLYVRVREASRVNTDVYYLSSSAGSEPPVPQLTQPAEVSVDDNDVDGLPDEVSRLLNEKQGSIRQNRIMK
jgi:hypothetical protein